MAKAPAQGRIGMRPDEACIRCGRKGRPTGLRRQEGPVCNTCVPWFREPEPCPRCGRMSRYLARALRLGIDEPVCPTCQRADHAICSACGRHRKLFETDDGRLLCRPCLDEGIRPCLECGSPMPAGRGVRGIRALASPDISSASRFSGRSVDGRCGASNGTWKGS